MYKRGRFEQATRKMVEGIINESRTCRVTLLLGSRRERFNSAVAVKGYIETKNEMLWNKKSRLGDEMP